ncbi:MAG: hypothetical protein EXS43_11055 [Opitutus sp.]|nr:hypothetical protein [Opitutus sp.]
MKSLFRILLFAGLLATRLLAVNPTVSVTAPLTGANVPVGSSLYLRATAADSDGFVAYAEFRVNTVLVKTVNTAPYNFVYTFATAGVVTIDARAYDNTAATTDATQISVNVVPAIGVGPVVTIASPSTTDTVVANQRVLITASATDGDGFIPGTSGVTFLLDGDPLPVLTSGSQLSSSEANPDLTPPYLLTWNPGVAKSYDLRAQATDDKGNIRLSPQLVINVVSPLPTVAIITPSTGSSVTLGSAVTVLANASGASGQTTSITKVDFYEDGILFQTDTTSPYSVTWTPAFARGTPYLLSARVTDSNGSTAASTPIQVSVLANTLPTVTIARPAASGSTIPTNTAFSLVAAASDADIGGSIASIVFYANGTIIGTATPETESTGNYRLSWTPASAGTFSITAVATDNANGSTTSAARTVTVSATGGIPPTVSLAMTGGGISIPIGSSRILTATATDDGAVARVEFYYDSELIGTAATAPYSLVVKAPASAGQHTIFARAYDNAGLVTNSTPIAINIAGALGLPPSIGITAPAAGAFIPISTVSTPITISGSTADADGSVSSVQVFANGSSIGTVASPGANWSLNWVPATVGVTTLVAIATDDKANAIASPPLTVNVTENTTPTISLTLSPGGSTMPINSIRNVVANAAVSVAGRAIVRVEFFVNGGKVGEDTSAPYTFRFASGAVPGNYLLSARATDNAGAARDAQIPLTVIAQVGARPTAILITPATNSTAVPNASLSLAATATAPGGTISSVQFYVNGSPTGITTGNPSVPPYIATYMPTQPGTYVFDVIATDDRGNTAVSNGALVLVNFGVPAVTITTPRVDSSNSVRVTPNVPLPITATATGGTGALVLLVEFLVDGTQIGTRTVAAPNTSNYSFPWTPTATDLGLHVLTVRVTDTNSVSATSSPLNLNVATVVGTPPTVTITSPGNQSILQSLSTVNLIATSFATGGTVSSVEFFVNDASVGLAAREQTTNVYRLPYDFSTINYASLTADTNGRYPITIYAIAKDSNGNQTASLTFTVFASPSQSLPPSVQLVTLGNPAVTAGTPFAVGATVQDSDGTVASVQLFANGTQVAQQTFPQFGTILIHTPQNAGRFNLYAVATDDTGNSSVSAPIVLNVTGNTSPTSVLVRPADDSTATTVNTPVFLEATASDPDVGQNVSVSFINTANGATLATGTRLGTTTTYRAIWTPNTAATFIVAARAADTAGATTTSSVSRSVVVTNIVGIAPVVSINVPGSATTASMANFIATATDSDGSVIDVEFFLNRNSIGHAVRDQLATSWRLTASFVGITPGNVEIVALARDTAGNVAASSTNNINVTAASSIAPSVSIVVTSGDASSGGATPPVISPPIAITPLPVEISPRADATTLPTITVPFSRQAQLTASARDYDGTVTSVQYFANGTNLGTSSNPATNFLVNWTPNQSGTFNVYAIATDNTGIATVSSTVLVTVRRNDPVLEDAAFVLQSYQDIANTQTINPLVFADLVAKIGSGAMSRADLVATLTDEPGFVPPVVFLATYYVVMGQWPTPANYTSLLPTARGSLPNAIGSILSSTEYFAKYGIVPTVALLENPASLIPEATFLNQLWQNAGLGPPQALDHLRFRSNNVASATLGLARGYNVVGLNTAIAELITNTLPLNDAALFKRTRAAAIFYQLDRPSTAVTTDQIAARVAVMAQLADDKSMAEAALKDIFYNYRYVTITKHPESLLVSPRSGAIFRVEAAGAPPLAYQWLLNGAPVRVANSATLSLTNVDASRVGTYTVVVTSAVASSTSDPATLTLATTATRLGNISTRGITATGNSVLTAGFVVSGTPNQTRQMLIRVVGPSLAAQGVTGVLDDPRLELYSGSNQVPIQINDNWGTQTGGATAVTALQQAMTRASAFPLSGTNSRDAAILPTLQPGLYSVQAKGPAVNASGAVIIEVYDVTAGGVAGPKAANVSTRGQIGTGNSIMTAGFVVTGTASRRLLIRGVGPTLQRFNLPVATLLADPQIALFNQSTGKAIQSNDNWASSDDAGIIAEAAVSGGAFPLANGSLDAAMVVMLSPGSYSVQMSGVRNTTGIGIVEVYDVDP